MLALKLAGDLAMAYPGRTVTEDHARAWAAEFRACSDEEARSATALLRRRSADPPSIAQVREALREASGDTYSQRQYIAHTYVDGVRCWCNEIHGHLIPFATVNHGIYHLRRYWLGHKEDRDRMYEPETCDCGWTS